MFLRLQEACAAKSLQATRPAARYLWAIQFVIMSARYQLQTRAWFSLVVTLLQAWWMTALICWGFHFLRTCIFLCLAQKEIIFVCIHNSSSNKQMSMASTDSEQISEVTVHLNVDVHLKKLVQAMILSTPDLTDSEQRSFRKHARLNWDTGAWRTVYYYYIQEAPNLLIFEKIKIFLTCYFENFFDTGSQMWVSQNPSAAVVFLCRALAWPLCSCADHFAFALSRCLMNSLQTFEAISRRLAGVAST